MFKIISSEEHAKLKEDVDYWKDLALKEANSLNFYETLYKSEKARVVELIRENQSLDRKLEELEQKEEVFEDFENFSEEDFYNLLVNIVKDIKDFPQLPVLRYWYNKLFDKGYKIRINEMNGLNYDYYYIWSIEKNYNTIVEYRDFKNSI